MEVGLRRVSSKKAKSESPHLQNRRMILNACKSTIQFNLAFVTERIEWGNVMGVDYLMDGFHFRPYSEDGAFGRVLDQVLDTIQQIGSQGEKLLPAMQRMVEVPITRLDIQWDFTAPSLVSSQGCAAYAMSSQPAGVARLLRRKARMTLIYKPLQRS